MNESFWLDSPIHLIKKKKAIRAIPMLGTATRSGGLDPEEVPAVTDSQAGGIVMALIPRRWEGKEK